MSLTVWHCMRGCRSVQWRRGPGVDAEAERSSVGAVTNLSASPDTDRLFYCIRDQNVNFLFDRNKFTLDKKGKRRSQVDERRHHWWNMGSATAVLTTPHLLCLSKAMCSAVCFNVHLDHSEPGGVGRPWNEWNAYILLLRLSTYLSCFIKHIVDRSRREIRLGRVEAKLETNR